MPSRFGVLVKAVLVVCFVGVSTAAFTAYQNPVTGYDLSIYSSTPILFWVYSCFALLVSILVVFSSVSRYMRMLGAFLGGLTMTMIVSLQIIRGYYYVGEADSLSHLGTAKEMHAGLRALTDSRYPIVHTISSVLHDVTGLALNHAMLILVIVFVVCYFVFVPLVVRELTGSSLTAYVGFFSGLLLLPVNHVSVYNQIHPSSQAIMYTPALFFGFLILFKQRTGRHSAIFLLSATMFVLLHPQQAANLVIFFGLIAVLQMGNDVLGGSWMGWRRKWVIPEVTFFAIVFLLWARNLPIFWRNFENVYMIPFEETQAAEATAMRTASLAQVGGSLPEVFMKLFSVSLIYILLTVLLMIVIRDSAGFTSRTSRDTTLPDGGAEQKLPLYIFSGLIGVTFVFLAYLIGGISDQYFRHLGMLMVFGTILGAIMIGRAMRYINRRISNSAARSRIVLLLILCTALSLPIVFSSPYIYYSSAHVTEMQVSGYETTFEHQKDSIVFDEVRSKVYRYGHAIQGTDLPEETYYQGEALRGVPDHFGDQSLRWHYDETVYVPVTEADRVRDPILWKGFRFSHEDFAYLNYEPGINKVQTNGGYDLYLVEPHGRSMNETP